MARNRSGQHEPHGPRGGLAGASDDFARWGQPRGDADREWQGWTPRGVIGRGAADDRIHHGAAEPPGFDERLDEDFRDGPDHDFGGRDTAAWYARHGGNADRMRARRRWQARHAGDDPRSGREVDPDYHLYAGERHHGQHYREAPDNPAWPGWGRDYGADYGGYGGDYDSETGDPYRAWPGHDFPGGRGLAARNWGAAPGEPGLAEPSYGSSPTRQEASLRGLAPAGYRRPDARIHDDLCRQLTEDPWVDARGVQVAVQDGEVRLSGEVADRRMKHRAEDIAAVCPGVTHIANELRVQQRGFTRADQRSA